MKILINFIILVLFLTQNVSSQEHTFYDLFRSGDKTLAVNKLMQLSENENLDAKYLLGMFYYDAQFLKLCDIKNFCSNNREKAYEIYLDLFENYNDPRAAYALGEMYDKQFYIFHSHLDPNLKKAFKYYLFVAKNGVPEAQYNVANMYEFGDGTKKNIIEAVRWYLQCNQSTLCGAGREGITDLIDQISKKDLEHIQSLIDPDLEEIDIRITVAQNIVLH